MLSDKITKKEFIKKAALLAGLAIISSKLNIFNKLFKDKTKDSLYGNGVYGGR